MKNYIFFFLILAGCTSNNNFNREKIPLSGEWKFRIDSLDQGVNDVWYNEAFTETVMLPGSMAENGKGEEVSLKTDWTGDIIDRTYFTDKKYEKYRQPGNIKIPFWLKPVKYYKGVAWYQKNADIPASWAGKSIVLYLERCHWESTVYVNGKSAGSENSLAVAHQYDITDLVMPGRNLISVRIDNSVIIPVGVNSHSISDHTQSNWNGIAGEISLRALPGVYINDITVIPDIHKKVAKVIVSIKNPGNSEFKGKLRIKAESFNSDNKQKIPVKHVTIETSSDKQQVILNYKIQKPQLWSEFNPALYRLTASLIDQGDGLVDKQSVDFGMREFRTNGTRFEINGQPVFLRGTLECCIFPLTGYPPTDAEEWERVLQICKDYGLNNIRFHSWCPPGAAFVAADKLGIYFHIECSSWANQGTTIGDGGPIDTFIYDEGDRIINEYGNHPSFCMLAYGNEPAGKNHKEFLGNLLKYWKAKDNRMIYTSAAGWPLIPESDFNLSPDPRIQRWGEGLKSIINGEPPRTDYDYRDFISKYSTPTVSHEIGQWCVYPDFKEISKYTGVLKATNFEIFRETLEENDMGDQAQDFLMASGKLQALCYKAEIEAALRTPGFGGFHLLQLHDFPGQGTALVGILNPFFESKGYITPEEFRMFCNETVPLARMKKVIYSNDESFSSDIEISHFGPMPLEKCSVRCQIIDSAGKVIFEELFYKDVVPTDNCISIGSMSADLSGIKEAGKFTLDVAVENTSFRNRWDFWVYPEIKEVVPGNVHITDTIDRETEEVLRSGGNVLLLAYGKVGQTKGAKVAIGFSSIFWNTAWTNNQPPHTLGILCDPGHPLFKGFPTEYHSNWQWWDPVAHSQAMILDGFPAALKPLIQPIDTWFENRRLALACEVKAGGGKLIVCSIDLKELSEERLVSKQLLSSMINYMNSNFFDPVYEVDLNIVRALTAGAKL